MEVDNIKYFLSFKNKEKCLTLDNDILELFNTLFPNKNKKKVNTNVLKNHKFQNQKDNIVNKVNLILNKLSEDNYELLVNEFINNINQITLEEYNEVLKTIYLKIILEINFIKIYLKFLKILNFLYNKVLQYNLSFFINIIETKFKSDYLTIELIDDTYIFLNNIIDEDKRINNLIIIKNIVDNNILDIKIISICSSILLNQNKYIPDIYYWFNINNIIPNETELIKIQSLIKNDTLLARDKILLENLLINKLNTNIFQLEINNILDIYCKDKSLELLTNFIDEKCKDGITKNKFCYYLINYYFIKENDILLNILYELLNMQIIFKSNLTRALSLINNDNIYNLNNKMINIINFYNDNKINIDN
jgi:hypothetical protein